MVVLLKYILRRKIVKMIGMLLAILFHVVNKRIVMVNLFGIVRYIQIILYILVYKLYYI